MNDIYVYTHYFATMIEMIVFHSQQNNVRIYASGDHTRVLVQICTITKWDIPIVGIKITKLMLSIYSVLNHC